MTNTATSFSLNILELFNCWRWEHIIHEFSKSTGTQTPSSTPFPYQIRVFDAANVNTPISVRWIRRWWPFWWPGWPWPLQLLCQAAGASVAKRRPRQRWQGDTRRCPTWVKLGGKGLAWWENVGSCGKHGWHKIITQQIFWARVHKMIILAES